MKERAARQPKWLGVIARDFWFVISLGLFVIYFLTAILRFWLWLVSLFFAFLASCLRLLTVPLSVLSGARPPTPQPKQLPLAVTGNDSAASTPPAPLPSKTRTAPARPIHHFVAPAHSAWHSFWHYSVERKVVAVTLSVGLVVLPAMYVVPRYHEVQVLDNNALNYQDSAIGQSTAGYLVHAIDISDPSTTRVYINETVWWLGKLNTQDLKARLRPGHYYRLWVVGWRWWYSPTLYPNIIFATEIDVQGNKITPTLTPTPNLAPTPPTTSPR